MVRYPKISVIVPMYNAAKTVKCCIESIVLLDYPNFEVIVVDDASTDNSISAVSNFSCRLFVLNKNSGPGVARNEGVKLATGEIVAFTDADCEVPGDWLKKIIRDFENFPIVAVSGGYAKSVSRGIIALFQFYDTSFRQRNISQYIDSCITSNFACKREIFEEVGGFPRLHINEDMEFAMAVTKRYKILWNKNNGVFHHYNNKFSSYFVKQVLWSESVTKLYLSEPNSILRKNTYSNSQICLHLLFTVLLYLSFFAIFLNFKSLSIFLFFMLSCFIINLNFVKFVAVKEGYVFSFKLFPFLLLRNTAWILGITKAALKHLVTILQPSKLREKPEAAEV